MVRLVLSLIMTNFISMWAACMKVLGMRPETKAKGGIQQERPGTIWKWKRIPATFHSFTCHLERFRMQNRRLTAPL